MSPIRKANIRLANRYFIMADEAINTSLFSINHELFHNIRNLCLTIMDETVEMYDDKSSRWIGFIQGILIGFECTSIETERKFSRELFHAAYVEMGLPIPETLTV